ncbi:MAG: hypothetical protein JWN71_2794 [Xanthobacteraceae bacterium]|nr:hypothetical protein [Xanthobacteraceae bacterium]
MTEQTAFILVAILCVLVVLTFLGQRLIKIQSRLDRLSSMDAKLDLLLKHAGLDYDPYKGLPPAVLEAILNGNKIEAIKRYREFAGVGLKEAKDFIEDVQRRGGVG